MNVPKLKPAPDDELPFWRRKAMKDMTRQEWESLCDGCGRCCLIKLEYEDTGEIDWTNIACRQLDPETCRCRNYKNRRRVVNDCVQLTPKNIASIDWLPPTCGYRLVNEGKDLYWWHPLVSGDPETVHIAGVSVRGRMSGTENEISDEELEDHIVSWPMRVPKKARQKT